MAYILFYDINIYKKRGKGTIMKLCLNSIYGQEDFQRENIHLDGIRMLASGLQPTISRSEQFFHPGALHSMILLQKAKEIIKTKNIGLETDVMKQLFINSYVFLDDDKFMNVLMQYDVNIQQIPAILNAIDQFKNNGSNFLSFRLKELELVQRHYNLHSPELLINKLNEILYYHPELMNSKKKQY